MAQFMVSVSTVLVPFLSRPARRSLFGNTERFGRELPQLSIQHWDGKFGIYFYFRSRDPVSLLLALL